MEAVWPQIFLLVHQIRWTRRVSNIPVATHNMSRTFRVHDIIALEKAAERSGSLDKTILVCSIDYYNQRPFWYDIFMGLTTAFDILFCQFILDTFPAPSYTDEYFDLVTYLRVWGGLPPLNEMFDLRAKTLMRRKKLSDIFLGQLDIFHTRSLPEPGYLAASPGSPEDELTYPSRQSKLSQEQLSELQRSTHFDKKELQQWYKGVYPARCLRRNLGANILRLPQRLPIWHAHKGRVSKNLSPILSFW